MHASAPFIAPVSHVRPEWIDYNGHLNFAYYLVLFDQAIDLAFDTFGLGPEHIATRNSTFYTLDLHISYLREVRGDDAVQVTLQMLDYDAKRTHFVQEMRHATAGHLCAVMEQVNIHVDLATGRSAPFPDDVLERIRAMHEAHRHLPVPAQVGRAIGIPRKG